MVVDRETDPSPPPVLFSSPQSQRSSPRQIEFLPSICLGGVTTPGPRAQEGACVCMHICLLSLLSHLEASLSVRRRPPLSPSSSPTSSSFPSEEAKKQRP